MNNSLQLISFGGYFKCKSSFGQYFCTCNDFNYTFKNGVTILLGDIDSGAWAISSTISNYKKYSSDYILDKRSKFVFNGIDTSLYDLQKYTYYLDKSFDTVFPRTISEYVDIGIKNSKALYTANDIRNLFEIDINQFNSKINTVGNSFLRCKAAIAYANNKKMYCFPWMSSKQYEYYLPSIEFLSSLLSSKKMIIIIPTNNISSIDKNYDMIELC